MAVVTLADVAEVVVVVVVRRVGLGLPLRAGELTLAAQVLLLQLGVIAVLLTAVGVLAVRQATDEFAEQRGAQMRSVAEYIAVQDGLRAALSRVVDGEDPAGPLPSALAPFADRGVSLGGATDVAVIAADGDHRVLGATDPSRVGRPADLGSSDAVLGRGWTGDVRVDGQRRVAAHAPVIAADGRTLAIVSSEEAYPSAFDRLSEAGPALVPYVGVAAVLGLLGAWLVARLVRSSTRGLGARDLAHLADQREALLHAIREGVVGVDTDGRVTVMNDAAREALGVHGHPEGRLVADLGLDPAVVVLLTDPEAEVVDALAAVGPRVLVLNRRAASAQGRGIGTVTTLRDRTELLALQGQLSSNLSITDTLRAQTHEFDNRLHTISGLLQLGEVQEAVALVGTLARHRAASAEHVTSRLHDAPVAALVLAKHARADERGVQLELDPGSHLPALPRDLSADLTTVVGNLVDNAIEACSGGLEPLVEVWLRSDEDAVHLRVRDNGPGVEADRRDEVFARGVTTKPVATGAVGGRGVGLALVRSLCRQRGGEVVLDGAGPGARPHGDTARGGGAEFRVRLPLPTGVVHDGAS